MPTKRTSDISTIDHKVSGNARFSAYYKNRGDVVGLGATKGAAMADLQEKLVRKGIPIYQSARSAGRSHATKGGSSVARQKLEAMKKGEVVVTNDEQMDQMLALDDTAIVKVRSLPNPRQVGLKDQYIAWIGSQTPPTRRSHATKKRAKPRVVDVEAATPAGYRWLRQHARGATLQADGTFAVTDEYEWAQSLGAAGAVEIKI